MLAANELDVSPQGPSLEFWRAWDPARPFVMVADHGSMRDGRGSGAVVARASLVQEGQLNDFADLRGKRIGLSPDRGDHDWLTFDAALRLGGLTFDDVEVVTVDFGGARHEALENGTIDLATVGRLQSIVEAKEAGTFLVWKYDYEIRPGRQHRALVFGHRFWTEYPDEAGRYVTAYLRGSRDYYDAFERDLDRQGVIEVLARESGYSPEHVAHEMVPEGLDPNGYLNVESIETDLAWFQKEGRVSSSISAEAAVDYQFLERALTELGRRS
jgi:NitT/TauT family transport system substrate-binding protein